MLNNPFHILLVDDDEGDRYFFEIAFKETGIPATLTFANNGVEIY